MVAILIFLLLCAAPVHAADYVGSTWGFFGDSQTAGRAPSASLLTSSPEAIDTLSTITSTEYISGIGGCSLSDSISRYSSYGGRANFTWVHVQESGNQNLTGQTTANEFASTFISSMTTLHAGSPNAVITYETAYSFKREAELYRDWSTYNATLATSVATLASSGITVKIADVNSSITWASAQLGDSVVWYQSGDTNEFHYTEVGNLMVAMTVWDALGYDVNILDYSGITDVSSGTITILKSYFKSGVPSNLNVSGTFSHGNTITITGTEFGTHTLQVKSINKNIEDGTTGSQFSASGWRTSADGASTTIPVYATDRAHSGSKSIKIGPYSSYNGIFVCDLDNPVSSGGKLYASWWVYYSGETDGQWKMVRMTKNLTVVDGLYQAGTFNWFGVQQYIILDPGTTNTQTLWSGQSAFPQANGWYRVELEYSASSTGVADGIMTIRTTSENGSISNDINTNALTHYDSNASWNYAIFQNYIGNGISNAAIWYDDVYIQTGTHARVELCSGDSWEERGKCEVQVPTEWSTTSITATINTGNFIENSDAYLYVVDADGTANTNGYAVTIGESSTPTPINGGMRISTGSTMRIGAGSTPITVQ